MNYKDSFQAFDALWFARVTYEHDKAQAPLYLSGQTPSIEYVEGQWMVDPSETNYVVSVSTDFSLYTSSNMCSCTKNLWYFE